MSNLHHHHLPKSYLDVGSPQSWFQVGEVGIGKVPRELQEGHLLVLVQPVGNHQKLPTVLHLELLLVAVAMKLKIREIDKIDKKKTIMLTYRNVWLGDVVKSSSGIETAMHNDCLIGSIRRWRRLLTRLSLNWVTLLAFIVRRSHKLNINKFYKQKRDFTNW